jgi:choline monooxygenase
MAAWHNVCQHRGARLVRESGRCATGSFKCPWHGFAYDLSGKLVHAPMAEAFDASELDGLRTPQVAVREWSGLVWIALTDDVPPLEAYLGELHGELGGYGFGGWTFRYADSWTIKANWKTVIDAFNEAWHLPFTHKNTVKGGLLWRDTALRIMHPHSMLAIPVRRYVERNGGIDSESDHRETMLCHYLAFPNTIFNCFPTHVQVFSSWPVGPRETVLAAWGALAPVPDGWSEEDWLALGDKGWANFQEVAAEDVDVLEDAGRVYDSLGFKRQMFNSAEGRLTAFHAAVNALAGVEGAS